MARKITRKGLIKKLDKLFSEKVRSEGFCKRCGRIKNLQCAHIYSRSNKNMRWDPMNAVCLCSGCHIFWAHKEPVEFTKWVGTFKDLDYLAKKKAETKPMSMADLEKILEDNVKI